VTCTNPSVDVNAQSTFQLVAHIPANAAKGTQYTNEATVTSDADNNPENDTSSATVTVGQQVDLSVTKFGPSSAAQNSNVTYTITMSNGGPDAATDATLSDTLPADMQFVSLSEQSGPAFSCDTPSPGFGGTITCTGNLSSGSSAQFQLVGHVPLHPGSHAYINTATVAPGQTDVDTNSG